MKLLKIFALATALLSPPCGVQAQVVTDPIWSRSPEEALKQFLMPGFALLVGISGTATIQCFVQEDGHPFFCRVLDESQPGLGFGSAGRLTIASAQVQVRRVDGIPQPSRIIATVRFFAPPVTDQQDRWTGREPTQSELDLARQVVEQSGEEPAQAEDWMDGLDYDRRQVVRPWIEELMVQSPERIRDVRTVQLARLFDEDQLRDILKGNYPDLPTSKQLSDASPARTTQEIASLAELRRRYCARFECP